MKTYPFTSTKKDFAARDETADELYTIDYVDTAVAEYLKGNTVVYTRIETKTEMDNRNLTITTTFRQWEPLP